MSLSKKNLDKLNKLKKKKNLNNEIDEAFKFAEESPFPESKEAFQGVYSKNVK